MLYDAHVCGGLASRNNRSFCTKLNENVPSNSPYTVSVLQKCMLNPQGSVVNNCRPRDRQKENKSRTEEEKKK